MRARVLIVDDEPSVLDGLGRVLRGTEYEVLTAAGAWAGIEAIRHTSFDVIVTDQCMPGMTGLELLAFARERQSRAIGILLSGRADLQTAVQAVNQGGVFRFLLKPVEPTGLLVALGAACRECQRVRAAPAARARGRRSNG